MRLLLCLLFSWLGGALLAPTLARPQDEVRYVDAHRVNLRAGPSTDAAKVTTMDRGEQIALVERQGDWLRVRTSAGREGWVLARLVAETKPPPRAEARLSDAEVKKRIVAEDIARTPGNCPCPFHVDRAGRACGRRSAYSRPGGYEPLCYTRNVTRAMVDDYRARHADP